jgi:hydroxyacylglutathione hydrolase
MMNYDNAAYYESIKLKNTLYCYIWQGGGNNCNSCLFPNVLKGNKPHLIIDPGHVRNEMGEPCFDLLTKSMEKDGFSANDIGLIINTHSHTDHCQANPVIVEKSNARIAMSREEEEFRHTGGKILDSMFGIKPTQFITSLFLKEGNFTLDSDELKIKLQMFLAPGHSPGSICIYVPDDKILITGDVIFYGSVGRTDFPGGNIQLLKESIDKLHELDIEYLVPGHFTGMDGVISGKSKVEQNFRMIQCYF